MLAVPIVFILLGILIKYGKMYSLIAGYNTMTKQEKEKYDIEGIATLMKNVMFGMAFIVTTGLVVTYWTDNSDYEFYALGLALILGIPYLLIKSNSKTYKIDNHLYKMTNITLKKVITFAKYLAIILLSIDMIVLAIPKLLQMQFRMPHYRAFVPLAELPKPELMMSFFGRSYAYNIFIGLTELAVGVLIVFKRTRLLGLLISLGVCLNVFIINFEFDMVYEVKRHITMTLVLTIALLFEYRKDLYKFFIELGGKLSGEAFSVKNTIWKKLRIGYVILFPIAYFIFSYVVISSFDYNLIGSYEIKNTEIENKTIEFKKGTLGSTPMLFFEKNNRVVLSVNDSIHYGSYTIENEDLFMRFWSTTNHPIEYIDAQFKDYTFITGTLNDSIPLQMEIERLPVEKDYLNGMYID